MQPNNIQQILIRIGMQLYELRRSRRERQAAIARSLHVSESMISAIENGQYKSLDFRTLASICNYYGIRLSDLEMNE